MRAISPFSSDSTNDVPTILRAKPGKVIAMRNGGVTAMRTAMFLMPVE